jgi:hypothetical protein
MIFCHLHKISDRLKLWDAHNFKVLKNFKNSAEISLSPDGNYFITTFGVLFKIE